MKFGIRSSRIRSFRSITLTIFLLILLGGLGWRVISLHVLEQGFLRHQGEMRTMRVVNIPAYRGMITDRFGEPLAISTPVASLWLNPKEFTPDHPEILTLASLLNLSLEDILNKYHRNVGREFVYVQRHVAPQVAAAVKLLEIPGIHVKSEYRRYYPAGEVTAHVLGFTNVDDHGQEGLEMAFDQWLSGAPGAKRVIRDRIGREVQMLEGIKDMQSGQDVVLSMDQRIQYLAYRELKAAVTQCQAASGSAVVLDVNTGEILAMVNQPSFNPNTRVKLKEGTFRNRAVTDVFEPGSVMKTFSVASALQSGSITPATIVDTAPGWMTVGGHVVKEIKNKNYGLLNVSGILQKSSNVGVSKLTLALPAQHLWSFYSSLGFGKVTGSGFPGETGGTLSQPPKNGSFVLATLAFGYGLSVTPLQLAQAYATLGAGGVKRPVSFLKQERSIEGERVVDPRVARQVLNMLTSVVNEGSGKKAQVLGYQAAGKTGTARKINPNGGYQENSHVAVFAGVAPASQPRFAIVIMIDDSATNVKLAKEHGYNACYVKTTSNSEPDDVMLGIHSDIFDREYLEFLVKDSEISVKELLAVADEISKKGGLMPFMICHLMTYAEELAKTKSKTESEAKTASDVPSVDSTSCSSKDITPKAIESTGKPFLPLASKLEVSTAVTATSSSSTSAASQSTAPAIPVAGSSTTVGSSVTASEEASSSPKLTATV